MVITLAYITLAYVTLDGGTLAKKLQNPEFGLRMHMQILIMNPESETLIPISNANVDY